MSVFALAFAQLATVSTVTPRFDLESETSPKWDVSCDVAQRSGRWLKLNFAVSGGQAYVVRYDSGNVSSIQRTDRVWKIVGSDEEFALFSRSLPVRKNDRSVIFNAANGEHLQFDGIIAQLDEISEVRLRRGIWRQPGGKSYVGFCSVKAVEQEPLSQDILTEQRLRELTQ